MTRRLTMGAAAAATTVLLGGAVAPAAFADHTRQHTCEQAGGTFTAGATQNLDRCVVVTETSTTAPFGAPIVTFSRPYPTGDPLVVDSPAEPEGEPTIDRQTNDVGEATDESVSVPGEPTTTTRTEQGTPTSTEAPGTRDCESVSESRSGGKSKGKEPVQRCERTVVTTTTTPTTVFTTVTTPQTEVTTTTQPREVCVTTTQPTSFERVTTQPQAQDRTVEYRQRTTTVTTTTRYRYANGTTGPLILLTNPNNPDFQNPRVQTRTTPAENLVQLQQTIPLPPRITRETHEGEPVVTGPVCSATAPEVTITERELEPTSETTSAPGAPIVSTSTRGTGEDCYRNPSNAQQRRNACA